VGAKKIAKRAGLSQARPSVNAAHVTSLDDAGEDAGLIVTQPHRLRNRPIGQDGNAINVLAGNRADVELQIESHFMVGMQARRGVHLQS
jgi:hypothetical protein